MVGARTKREEIADYPKDFFLISDSARSRLRVPASIDARPMIDECLVVVSDGYPTGGIRLG